MNAAAIALRRAISAHEKALAELRSALAALEAESHESDGAAKVEGARPKVHVPAFLSLKEAAFHLGLSYDAARMRAKRAGVIVADGRDALIPADWVNRVVRKNSENVRTCSVAEQVNGGRYFRER